MCVYIHIYSVYVSMYIHGDMCTTCTVTESLVSGSGAGSSKNADVSAPTADKHHRAPGWSAASALD